MVSSLTERVARVIQDDHDGLHQADDPVDGPGGPRPAWWWYSAAAEAAVREVLKAQAARWPGLRLALATFARENGLEPPPWA